jgi:hypothetical protein
MDNKFSDGSSAAYEELPIQAAYLSWTRGNAQLRAIAAADPGAYLGGWRAFVMGREDTILPAIPLPVVERMSEDGKHPYKVYAHNYVNFLPIIHRTRFELRQKVKDEQTGKEYDRVINISRERREGYAPYRQVFGLLYSNDGKESAPAVLKVWKWSAFISFEKAGQAWNKIKVPDGKILLRRYGTVGTKTDGGVVPNFEVFGQSRSTPIEAIGTSKPVFFDITEELNTLYDSALPWKNCERWNAEGKVQEDDTNSAKSQFLAKCADLGLSNIDIEQLIAENDGDYQKAMLCIVTPEQAGPDIGDGENMPY